MVNTDLLRGIRTTKRLTQIDIANMMGMALKTYNNKERGNVEFSNVETEKISEILDLTIQDVNKIFFGNKIKV